MKQSVTVNTAVLQRTLANVERIIRPTPLLPVCAYLNIVCEDGKMVVTGTDCQGWLVAEIPLPIPIKATALIDAKKLAGAVSTATTETTTLTFEDSPKRLIVKSGRSVFRLASASGAMEFPGPTTIDRGDASVFEVSGPVLAKAIRKVAFAAARGDIRHFLNGVAIQGDGQQLSLIGTNGHQLAKTSIALTAPLERGVNIILAVEYLGILARFCEADNITVAIGRKLEIRTSSLLCHLPLIEGQFPDWGRVIPKDNPCQLTVNRTALTEAITRVSYCMNEKQKAVWLKASSDSGLLTVRSQDDENQVEDEIEAQNQGLEVSLSHVYLKDVISVIENTDVVISSRDHGSSVLFLDKSDPNWLAVIMPMRI
ncbi:DNA polymerase III subunit beta [Noviherbaspirillum malthae]|uniref:DNA polymerase III subunit beta n=1 Tax=Noviherbaspirillum malthae TaxID=1260987 RepID=UPI00188E1C46|nr:DNA polymerase III subunit beta [Noviherbaspirillum malthae]